MDNCVVIGDLLPTQKALVMVHGRGSTAQDILSLSQHLQLSNFSFVAPQASGNTWYPYSFMAPQQENQPFLGLSLKALTDVTTAIADRGIACSDTYFLGFSQGACLVLEFTARHAKKWGGIIAFTGALIGDKINTANYGDSFLETPVYIGSSDPDPHVPAARVYETEKIFLEMNANVEVQLFKNMGHTIIQEEIEKAKLILNGKWI